MDSDGDDDHDFYCGGCYDDDDWGDDDGVGADGFYDDDDDGDGIIDLFDPLHYFDDDDDDDVGEERLIPLADHGFDVDFDLNDDPHIDADEDAEFDLNQDPHDGNDDADAEFDLNQDPHGAVDAEFDLNDDAIGVENHGGDVVDDVDDEFFVPRRVRESSSSGDRGMDRTDVFDMVFERSRRVEMHGGDVDDDVVDDEFFVPPRVIDTSSSMDRVMDVTDVFDLVVQRSSGVRLLMDDDHYSVDDYGDDVYDTDTILHGFASGSVRLGTWSDSDDYDGAGFSTPVRRSMLGEDHEDEWDGGRVRGGVVVDDVGEGVSGVAWDGGDEWGDEEWQEEETIGVVSSGRVEVTGAEDNVGVVSSSGVDQCKGVESIESGIDGLPCPICMDPLSREGEHIACCLPCGHLYGMSCIKTWLQQKAMGKCPQCNKVCTFVNVRRLYLPQMTVANEEMQDKIMILEAKCASLELKDAEWSKKEAEWNQKEAELRNQLNQQREAAVDELVG